MVICAVCRAHKLVNQKPQKNEKSESKRNKSKKELLHHTRNRKRCEINKIPATKTITNQERANEK